MRLVGDGVCEWLGGGCVTSVTSPGPDAGDFPSILSPPMFATSHHGLKWGGRISGQHHRQNLHDVTSWPRHTGKMTELEDKW